MMDGERNQVNEDGKPLETDSANSHNSTNSPNSATSPNSPRVSFHLPNETNEREGHEEHSDEVGNASLEESKWSILKEAVHGHTHAQLKELTGKAGKASCNENLESSGSDGRDGNDGSDRRDGSNETANGGENENYENYHIHPENEENDPLPLLIEIVGATLPKQNDFFGSKWDEARGMHCTVYWVGPSPSSSPCISASASDTSPATLDTLLTSKRRKELLLHRTKTLKVDGGSDPTKGSAPNKSSPSSSPAPTKASERKKLDEVPPQPSTKSTNTQEFEEDENEHARNAEHIFTVEDASLFVFHTTMRQLVNASFRAKCKDNVTADASDHVENTISKISDANNVTNVTSGGLRFDLFEKPLDVLSQTIRNVSGGSISEKEENATNARQFRQSRQSSPSSPLNSGYRLLGSVFLTPEEILNHCDEERFECDLLDHWRYLQHGKHTEHTTLKSLKRQWSKVETVEPSSAGRLALRIRHASNYDLAFLKSLATMDTSYAPNAAPSTLDFFTEIASHTNINEHHLQYSPLVTEMDENTYTAQSSLKALGEMAPAAHERLRYLFSNDSEQRLLVKPYPDPSSPSRTTQTTFLTKDQLRKECYSSSTRWTSGGSGSLGKVFVEILHCRDLPNVDAGESFGNMTDAFVSIVYNDVMVQTDIINDELSPMWMPWSKRAFMFRMNHPSSHLFVGVTDYDVGPGQHENIGRVAVNLGKFTPGTLYTLTYRLHESSNLMEHGDGVGTITFRLRVEYDEQKYLMVGKTPPERIWVNSLQWKTHRVAKYCVDGPHDDDVFEMRLFRSHINEILTNKRMLTYTICDTFESLVFWRGQVKVGNVWLPLHSAIAFYFGIQVVEKPQLLPSLFFFTCGWIMVAGMLGSSSNPNPWRRGQSFSYFWNVLTGYVTFLPTISDGKSRHMPKTIKPYQGHKEYTKQEKAWSDRLEEDNEKYAKQAELDAKVADISNDTIIRTKATASGPLIDSLLASRLLPYQQRLSRYCAKIRYFKSVLSWNESVLSFWLTLWFFGVAFISLFVPWAFLLRWTSRLGVWVFLGPWMKLADFYLHGLTNEEAKARLRAKTLNTLMKSFQEKRKAAKILRENALKLKAHRVKLFGQYITKLPEYYLSRHEDIPQPESYAEPFLEEDSIDLKLFVPGQNLSGVMIPMTKTKPRLSVEEEKVNLVRQYNQLVQKRKAESEQAPKEDDPDEGFELIDAEDHVICLQQSESPDNKTTRDQLIPFKENENDLTVLDSSKETAISDSAIQAALSNQLQDSFKKPKTKSRWVFSASISLSLKHETVEDQQKMIGSDNLALTDSASSLRKRIKHEPEEIEEEGVEVVPLLADLKTRDEIHTSTPDEVPQQKENDHVSVFYVDDKGSIADLD